MLLCYEGETQLNLKVISFHYNILFFFAIEFYQSACAQSMMERREEEKLCDHLIKSAKRRDHSMALRQRDKVLNILTNKHGAWGSDGDYG